MLPASSRHCLCHLFRAPSLVSASRCTSFPRRSTTQLPPTPIVMIYTVGPTSQLATGRSQFLLDRLGRRLKLSVSTESTSCHEFASQFGLDISVYAKNTKNYREYRVARATVYLNEAATGHWSPAESAKRGVNSVMGGLHRHIEQRQPERRRRCVGVCVCASVCVCVCVCVRACVLACVRAWRVCNILLLIVSECGAELCLELGLLKINAIYVCGVETRPNVE